MIRSVLMKKSTVALIVAAVILGGAFISVTVFGVLKIVDKRSGDDLPIVTVYESVTLEQEETTGERYTKEFTEYSVTEPEKTALETQADERNGGYLETLSAEEIELLNLFLSNFSEAYVYEIDNTDFNSMINFIYINTKINYRQNIYDFDEHKHFDDSTHVYGEYITEEYMHARLKRYFGVEIPPVSTDLLYYSDGKYYIAMADGETYDHFSKVTAATENPDGTITVEFDTYTYDPEWGYDSPPEEVYKGIGSENLDSLSVYTHSGTAVLEPVYLGEGYANYHLISMEKN